MLFFDPDGALMGKHRKLMPTAAERLIWGQGDGSTMPVFDTPIGRLGAVICWENYMPMLRMHMYARGIQLYCARPPTTARPGSRRCATSRSRAGASSWAATSTRIAPTTRPTIPPSRAMTPRPSCRAAGAASSTRWAGSSPARRSTARRSSTADLDLDEIARGKFDFDVAGHYARPDVFRLVVNEAPTPVVVREPVPTAARRTARD